MVINEIYLFNVWKSKEDMKRTIRVCVKEIAQWQPVTDRWYLVTHQIRFLVNMTTNTPREFSRAAFATPFGRADHSAYLFTFRSSMWRRAVASLWQESPISPSFLPLAFGGFCRWCPTLCSSQKAESTQLVSVLLSPWLAALAASMGSVFRGTLSRGKKVEIGKSWEKG